MLRSVIVQIPRWRHVQTRPIAAKTLGADLVTGSSLRVAFPFCPCLPESLDADLLWQSPRTCCNANLKELNAKPRTLASVLYMPSMTPGPAKVKTFFDCGFPPFAGVNEIVKSPGPSHTRDSALY